MLWTTVLLGAVGAVPPVTTGSLLQEMSDLERLTCLADPSHKLVQFSSYDRRSTAPYAPGWYANSDGFGGEPIPNFLATLEEPNAEGVGRYLMAEVNGPGAIVRTWSAVHTGTIRVWVDDAETPLYDGPAEPFLVDTYRVFAEKAGIEVPEQDGFRQNMSCYLPIPFANHLVVEWIGKVEEIHFYHIETRLFAPGTAVRAFRPSDLVTYAAERDAAQQVLLGADPPLPADGEVRPIDLATEPRTLTEALSSEGEGEIAELTLKLEAADLLQALRQTELRIHFDGSAQPQVHSPVGDFFGSGPGVNPYVSLPFTVLADGSMTCRFRMPWARSMSLRINNTGDQPVRVTGQAVIRPRAWTPESLHFRSVWQIDNGLVAAGGEGAIDLPILTARGAGHFVGVAVMLLNPCEIPTEGGNWWGEGDEKVWTDDDEFPSLFGTGSEDYFNYAWSRPDHFWHAYCAQSLNTGPGTRGLISNNRFHVLDAIPFARSIDFCLELFHHSLTPGFSYARTAYFYATERTRDRRVSLAPPELREALEVPDGWNPVAAGGAHGATFFPGEEALVAGQAGVEVVDGRMWQGRKLVLWKPAEGGTLEFRVTAPSAGRWQVALTAGLSPRGGRFALSVDGGAPMGPRPDLFTPYHELSRNCFFDTLELTEGEHTITLTPDGRNAESAGSEVGIDFLWLIRR